MQVILVIVADGAAARFFTLESSATPEYESSPYLVAGETIANPSQELTGEELWSAPQSQVGHYQGSVQNYDDHRQQHQVEYERRYAAQIVDKIQDYRQSHHVDELIIVAEHKLLGLLRDVLPKIPNIVELDKNLSHLNPKEIHEYLAKQDVLPASIIPNL